MHPSQERSLTPHWRTITRKLSKTNLVLSTLIVLPSSLPPSINLVYQQRSILKNHEIGWKCLNGKNKSNSLQSWMSLYGQREVISADWQDLEESCPIWNTRSPPGFRKFDEPSNRVEVELSIRKIFCVSGPFIFFHVAEESEPGIWGMLSLCGPSAVACGLDRLELGRNLPQS